MRDREWKLIGAEGRPKMSLHRLTDEKPEVKNYAKEKPEIVARLAKLHQMWASEVKPAHEISEFSALPVQRRENKKGADSCETAPSGNFGGGILPP